MIEISQRERPAIFQKIKANSARNVRKRPVAIVRIKYIPFITAPGAIGTEEFVESAPSLFVFMSRLGFVWRIGNHTPPKKTVQVLSRGARHHSIHDVEVREAVVIEI